jgi:hypothetical protein
MLNLYSVFDSAAKAFTNPMVYRTDLEAMRAFETTVNAPDNQFNTYPDHFTLFQLGSFDELSGSILSLPTPKSLGLASQFVHAKV